MKKNFPPFYVIDKLVDQKKAIFGQKEARIVEKYVSKCNIRAGVYDTVFLDTINITSAAARSPFFICSLSFAVVCCQNQFFKMTESSAPETATATPVAAKTKKAKTPKAKTGVKKAASTHPPTSAMVNNAIKNLKERGGSSLQAIKKYISATYKVDAEKIAPFIKKYLKSAVDSGALVQTKGKGAAGSFKLPAAGTASGAKKPAVKKPKAVKKAVKPKAEKKAKATPKKAKAAAKPKTAKPKAAKKSPIKAKKAAKPAAAKKPKTPKKSPKKAVKKPAAAKK